ncbi:hypothetical protein Taro_019085 [Colocasia esculenta]|uniref:Uncharacterized protein n=1 Tax=Colocasia esculenta TaxID=4460 RepID=A0A843UY82_COLES|nr:hypothetical protein [Colocasia esculenta]
MGLAKRTPSFYSFDRSRFQTLNPFPLPAPRLRRSRRPHSRPGRRPAPPPTSSAAYGLGVPDDLGSVRGLEDEENRRQASFPLRSRGAAGLFLPSGDRRSVRQSRQGQCGEAGVIWTGTRSAQRDHE